MEQDFPAGCIVVEIDKPGLFAIFFSKIENVLPSRSLRSKRSRTKRTKFHISSRAKNGVRAKRWKEGGGGGEEGNACPQTPQF